MSLSIKNCQAIELGYDLDELAKSEASKISETEVRDEKLERIYKRGFQKALELMGDKKFSEQDVLKVVTHVLNELVLVDGFDKQYLFPESIYQETTTKCKSLQQTEWDVEIEMEWIQSTSILGNPHQIPKLDADGCLILKRI